MLESMKVLVKRGTGTVREETTTAPRHNTRSSARAPVRTYDSRTSMRARDRRIEKEGKPFECGFRNHVRKFALLPQRRAASGSSTGRRWRRARANLAARGGDGLRREHSSAGSRGGDGGEAAEEAR